MAEDTIPVRPDEQFESHRLADYLRGRLPGSEQPLSVRQFGGGKANLTYLLQYSENEYVLRRPPLGPVAASAHDMAREYRVLAVLHQALPTAPQAFLYCDDPAIIGAPFFIMARKYGVVFRRNLPGNFSPEDGAALSHALVQALADLHAVDYAALGLTSLGRPSGFVARQIDGWYQRWQAAQLTPNAEMDWLYAWLQAHQPPENAPTLLHNDFKLDNVMFVPGDPTRVTAIFDWDMCTLGDPLCDLGTLLTYWTQPDDPPIMQAFAMFPYDQARFATRSQLVQAYASLTGRDVSHIRFYHVLGLYRLVVIIAQIYFRYAKGQTQDPRFATFDQLIPAIAQTAWHTAQTTS